MENESEIKVITDEPDKMTLDGAIAFYEQMAKEQLSFYNSCPWSDGQLCDGRDNCKSLVNGENKGCIKLLNEYEQLVTWLKDYKEDEEHLQDTRDEAI